MVYTATFGPYDFVPAPRIPRRARQRVDAICFCDDPTRVPSGWRAVVVELEGRDPVLANRRLKIVGHPELNAFDRSLYIDGNIALRGDPTDFLDAVLKDAPIAIPAHPGRNCVYDEAEACVGWGKITAAEAMRHVKSLERRRIPRQLGLTENSIIAMNRRDPRLKRLIDEWWGLVEEGPSRDQLHLQPLVFEEGLELAVISRAQLADAGLFLKLPHRHQSRRFRGLFFEIMAATFDQPLGQTLERLLLLWRQLRRQS